MPVDPIPVPEPPMIPPTQPEPIQVGSFAWGVPNPGNDAPFGIDEEDAEGPREPEDE